MKKRIRHYLHRQPWYHRYRYGPLLGTVIGWLLSDLQMAARREAQLYSELLDLLGAPAKLCFDIGAHRGDISARLLATGATVVAVEPQPHFQRVLSGRFHGESRFNLLPVAVGARSGTQSLLLNETRDARSTLSEEWHRHQPENQDGPTATIEVEVTTLRGLMQEHGVPDLLKIDVEGYEREVLSTFDHESIGLIVFEANLELFLAESLQIVEQLLPDYRFAIAEDLQLGKEWFDSLPALTQTLRQLAPASVDVVALRKN